MNRCAVILLMLGALLGWSLPAQAETCVATASNVAFGNISPVANAAATSTGSVTVTCTWSTVTLTPYALVCLNLGSGDGSSSASPRSLANGSNLLSYNLYADPAYSTIWGSSSNTTATTPISVTLSANGLIGGGNVSSTVVIYGQIPAGQTTVPTVSNSNTVYTENFSGTYTRLDYQFYLLNLSPPTCSSIAANTVRFPFSVTATVVNNCNISATPLNFGSSPLINTTLSATSSISVQCTNNDAYEVALNSGTTTGASVTGRKMKGENHGSTVGYQLYLDAAHTTPWGDGTSGTSLSTGTGTGVTQTLTVYGQVPNQSAPTPDTYTDTITATVYF